MSRALLWVLTAVVSGGVAIVMALVTRTPANVHSPVHEVTAAPSVEVEATTNSEESLAGPPRQVHMVGQDNLTFSVTNIEARPGELLEIELHTIGVLPPELLKHNLVVLSPDVSLNGFIAVAATARQDGYVPAALEEQIIAATGLAGQNETVRTIFHAPKTPGRYPFVCSYPGHFVAGMKGTLIVK